MSEIVKSLKAWNNFANGGPRPEGPLVRYEEAANEVESLEQRIRELVQQCEKLREERNTVRVKVEQPLLLRISELEAALDFIRKETLTPNDRLYLHDIANNVLKEPPQ